MIARMEERKGLTDDVKRSLARSQWDQQSLKMGKEGGVREAEAWLGAIGKPRAMMLRTGLQCIGDKSLELAEIMDLEKLVKGQQARLEKYEKLHQQKLWDDIARQIPGQHRMWCRGDT